MSHCGILRTAKSIWNFRKFFQLFIAPQENRVFKAALCHTDIIMPFFVQGRFRIRISSPGLYHHVHTRMSDSFEDDDVNFLIHDQMKNARNNVTQIRLYGPADFNHTSNSTCFFNHIVPNTACPTTTDTLTTDRQPLSIPTRPTGS